MQRVDKDNWVISIFNAKTLDCIHEFESQKYKKEAWPLVKFTNGDELAFYSPKSGIIQVLNPEQKF